MGPILPTSLAYLLQKTGVKGSNGYGTRIDGGGGGGGATNKKIKASLTGGGCEGAGALRCTLAHPDPLVRVELAFHTGGYGPTYPTRCSSAKELALV